MNAPLRTLPNIEALVVAFLRADPDVAAITGPRVYAGTLDTDTRPCVRVTRYGGRPLMQVPLEIDQAALQIDAWGRTRAETVDLAALIRSALAARLPGAHHRPDAPSGVVVAVDLGALSHTVDDAYDPAWPRAIADVTVTYRPA